MPQNHDPNDMSSIQELRRRMDTEIFEYGLLVEKLNRIKGDLGHSNSGWGRRASVEKTTIERTQLTGGDPKKYAGLASSRPEDLGLQ